MLAAFPLVVSAVISAEDPVPTDNDVVAGAWGALFFVLLITATVLLLRNFLKQMRKVDDAEEAGVFDEQPTSATSQGSSRVDDEVDPRVSDEVDPRVSDG